MCNLQSNLKLNKRKRGREREWAVRGRKRETQMKEETRHTGECEGRERVLSIYTHGIPPGSLQDLFSHCLQKCGERKRGKQNAEQEREKGETAQCARGSRDIVVLLASLRRRLPKPPKSWMLLFVSGFSSVWKFQRARRYRSARGRWRCSGNVVPRELLETNDTSGKKHMEFLSLTSK